MLIGKIYSNGGKETEKRTIKISLLLYVALLVSAVVDVALSYNYFIYETEIFITTESNGEFVDFLISGDFPVHNFIKFSIALPLLLFILSWFDILHESINNVPMLFVERFGRIVTFAIPSLFCVSYSCSGFTWYTDSRLIYDLLSVTETLINSCIMIVLVSLYALTLYLLCGQEKISLNFL